MELTVKQLKEKCREKGITGYSRLNKEQLIEALKEPTIDEKFINNLPGSVEVIKYKDKEDWLEVRKLGVGGSEVSAILGYNKYRSAIDIYMDKKNMKPKVDINKFAHWGNMLEPVIAEEFNFLHSEYEVKPLDVTLKRGYSLANIDRLIFHKDKGYGVLEIKTTNAFNQDEWEENSVPPNYYCQVMHYLAVTGLKYAYLVVLIGGNDYREYYIERNENECNVILKVCEDFWNNNIIGNLVPEPTGSKEYSDYLKDKIGNLETFEGEISDDNNLSDKLKQVKESMKELEQEEERIKQVILTEALDKGYTDVKCGKITIKKQARTTKKLDTDKLKEVVEDLESYYTENITYSNVMKLKK